MLAVSINPAYALSEIAVGKSVWSSPYTNPPENAIDRTGAFWTPNPITSGYWGIDLGSTFDIDSVGLVTNAATYNIYINGSNDNTTYTTIYSNPAWVAPGGTSIQNFTVSASYRYINISLTTAVAVVLDEVYVYVSNPELLTPTNGSTETKTYPPLTEDINFTWSNGGDFRSNLVVARDINFNLIAVNTLVSTNYSSQALEAGDYWWKVRYYNSTTGTYGNYSGTFNFTLSETSAATGTGIEGIVYELIGGVQTPISGATVYLYNNTLSQSTITGSNGYYLFSGLYNSTTYNVYATKQGYDTTAAFPVTTGVGTVVSNDILMKIYISPYVPNFVFEKFVVSGLFDNPYPGVTVNVYKGDDLTISFTGVTDTAGQVVFQLIKDQKYRVTFSGGGLSDTLTYHIYGKEEVYLVTVITGFPAGGDKNEDINATFLVTSFNATYSNLSLFYNDTRSSTTSINFTVRSISSINSSSLTNVCSNLNSTNQTVTLNCTVLASGSYLLNYTAVSSIYGTFHASKVVNFDIGSTSNPSVPLSGVSSNVLNWIAIMLIVLVAALFSIRTVKFGALIIPSIAMVFWAFGWLNAPFLLVSTALALGILVYVRMSEVKVNY